MDVRLYITKIIQLLYRARSIQLEGFDDLVRSSMSLIKLDNTEELFLGVSKTKQLLDYAINMLSEKEQYDVNNLLSDLEVMLENDVKLFKTLSRSLSKVMTPEDTKGLIASISKDLSVFIREEKIINLFAKASNDVRFNRLQIGDLATYSRTFIASLEPLTVKTEVDYDPAIVKEVDFDNEDELETVFSSVIDRQNDSGIYRFGWQGLNRMTQNGILPGEFMTIGALQHNYKTGGSLSITSQILRYNNPIVKDHEKHLKPLIIRLSLEDSVENNFQFLFHYLKAQEGIRLSAKEIARFSPKEMSTYIKQQLTKNGFSVKMMRVDPSMWTFTELFNFILKQESLGYKVCGLIIDYVSMLPTTGCIQGGHGVDKRDLVRRIRNFTSARDIFFITPLQLSTEAKQLLRNGITGIQFLKEIESKGYYADSKQYDQEIDLEIYQILAKANGVTYLAFGLGKHRRSTILEDDKYRNFLLPFPGPNQPLKEDVNSDDTTLYSFPRTGGSSDMFSESFM